MDPFGNAKELFIVTSVYQKGRSTIHQWMWVVRKSLNLRVSSANQKQVYKLLGEIPPFFFVLCRVRKQFFDMTRPGDSSNSVTLKLKNRCKKKLHGIPSSIHSRSSCCFLSFWCFWKLLWRSLNPCPACGDFPCQIRKRKKKRFRV